MWEASQPGAVREIRQTSDQAVGVGSDSIWNQSALVVVANSPVNKMGFLPFSHPASCHSSPKSTEWKGFSILSHGHWSHGNAGELAAGSDLLGLTGFLPGNTPCPEGRSFCFSEWGMSSGFLSRVRSVVCCPASMLPFLEAAHFVLSLGYPQPPQKRSWDKDLGASYFWGKESPKALWGSRHRMETNMGGLIRSVWLMGSHSLGDLEKWCGAPIPLGVSGLGSLFTNFYYFMLRVSLRALTLWYFQFVKYIPGDREFPQSERCRESLKSTGKVCKWASGKDAGSGQSTDSPCYTLENREERWEEMRSLVMDQALPEAYTDFSFICTYKFPILFKLA